MLELFANGTATPTGIGAVLENGPKSIFTIKTAWTESAIQWLNAPEICSTAVDTCVNSKINTWESFDVSGEIKNIIENGAENNGFMLAFPAYNHGVTYSSSEDIFNKSSNPKLTVTYEPSTSIWYQQYKGIPAAESYAVTITNIQGKVILTFVAKDLNRINKKINKLPSGLYTVRISIPGMKFNYMAQFVK